MSSIIEKGYGVGDVISLLWFKRSLPRYCTQFIEVDYSILHSAELSFNLLISLHFSVCLFLKCVQLSMLKPFLDMSLCCQFFIWILLFKEKYSISSSSFYFTDALRWSDMHHSMCRSRSLCLWCSQCHSDGKGWEGPCLQSCIR